VDTEESEALFWCCTDMGSTKNPTMREPDSHCWHWAGVFHNDVDVVVDKLVVRDGSNFRS